jgi:hypothetical protein
MSISTQRATSHTRLRGSDCHLQLLKPSKPPSPTPLGIGRKEWERRQQPRQHAAVNQSSYNRQKKS